MNIGFVGVGRMGANMARRLKDREFHVTSVYDTNRAAATSFAAEIGCAASQDLSEVTAESDVIFTVVTDDAAMREIFAEAETISWSMRGASCSSTARRFRRKFMSMLKSWRRKLARDARSVYGIEYYSGARG
jgi:3-hydroxyisobutyrate dehydrogenase-like beta-hydroxyacid dehydrogenase